MDWFSGLTIEKDPDSVLDYLWDFSDWLASGDTVSSHVVEATSGITVESSVNDSTGVTVWLSGGTSGEAYTVTVRITTFQGRVLDRSVVFVVTEK